MIPVRFLICVILLFQIVVVVPASCLAATASLLCPIESPPGPILTGMEEIEQVLKKQGWTVRRSLGDQADSRGSADVQFILIPFQSYNNSEKEAELFENVIPTAPESLSLVKVSSEEGNRCYILGSDAVGTMYAAFELAEQIERSAQIPMMQRIEEVKKSPSIPNRGIKLMLQKQALEDPYSWFHSESFWKGFLHTLAISRFNYLELQGVYDLVTTQYSNVLPYLAGINSYLPAELVERNQHSFQRIVEQAHRCGLTVSLINAGADWGKTVSPDDRDTLQKVFSASLQRLLEVVPDLDGIGFRISRNPLPTEFYRSTYLQAIQDQERKPLLLLSTWAAEPTEVRRLVDANQGRTVLEVKFNGDHLALPYPVTGGRMHQWASYGYQDYFNLPRTYGVLFELPFNGTHRIFPWGDSIFIRRTLENSTYAGANGFVLQTYSTFLPHADAFTNPIRSDLRYYDWTYERDWYWYLLWGRLAYDIELPTPFFERKFQEHFGDRAGLLLFKALQHASQVIPALAAVNFKGPDVRDVAPELETPKHLDEIIQAQPLDSFTIRSMTEEVNVLVEGIQDSRYSPVDLLTQAVDAAIASVTLAAQAGQVLKNEPGSAHSSPTDHPVRLLKEWNSWYLDFQTLAALGQYWRDQFQAAIQLGIYQRTGDIPSLIIASEKVEANGHEWKSVQDLTSIHYRPILDALHNQTPRFHWNLYPSFEQEDRLKMTRLYNAWLNQTDWPTANGHLPVHKILSSASALLTLSLPPKIKVDSIFVQYQNQLGEAARFPLAPSQLEGVYYTKISPDVLSEGSFNYFFLGKRTEWGDSWVIPKGRKPFSIMVTDDNTPPFCSSLQHMRSRSGNRVFVTAKFSDPSGIQSAMIWWKLLPSGEKWNKTTMEGEGEVFQGSFVVTPQGAQYAVEVSDRFGNILRMPDMRTENPYRTIPPFTR